MKTRKTVLLAFLVLLTSCAHLRPEGELLSAEEHLRLGAIYESKGEHDLALRQYERAALQDGGMAEAHFAMGNLFLKERRLKEAQSSYLKAIELDPDEALFHNNVGWVYMETERYEEAEQAVKRALEMDPGRSYIYLDTLGVLYTRTGRYEEAEKNLLTAEGLVPGEQIQGLREVYGHLLELYSKTGEEEKAAAVEEKIKGLDGSL